MISYHFKTKGIAKLQRLGIFHHVWMVAGFVNGSAASWKKMLQAASLLQC
jgi:hypothetical protein